MTRTRQIIAVVLLASGIITWHSGEHNNNYVSVAVGGALMGLFVSVVAPRTVR